MFNLRNILAIARNKKIDYLQEWITAQAAKGFVEFHCLMSGGTVIILDTQTLITKPKTLRSVPFMCKAVKVVEDNGSPAQVVVWMGWQKDSNETILTPESSF